MPIVRYSPWGSNSKIDNLPGGYLAQRISKGFVIGCCLLGVPPAYRAMIKPQILR